MFLIKRSAVLFFLAASAAAGSDARKTTPIGRLRGAGGGYRRRLVDELLSESYLIEKCCDEDVPNHGYFMSCVADVVKGKSEEEKAAWKIIAEHSCHKPETAADDGSPSKDSMDEAAADAYSDSAMPSASESMSYSADGETHDGGTPEEEEKGDPPGHEKKMETPAGGNYNNAAEKPHGESDRGEPEENYGQMKKVENHTMTPTGDYDAADEPADEEPKNRGQARKDELHTERDEALYQAADAVKRLTKCMGEALAMVEEDVADESTEGGEYDKKLDECTKLKEKKEHFEQKAMDKQREINTQKEMDDMDAAYADGDYRRKLADDSLSESHLLEMCCDRAAPNHGMFMSCVTDVLNGTGRTAEEKEAWMIIADRYCHKPLVAAGGAPSASLYETAAAAADGDASSGSDESMSYSEDSEEGDMPKDKDMPHGLTQKAGTAADDNADAQSNASYGERENYSQTMKKEELRKERDEAMHHAADADNRLTTCMSEAQTLQQDGTMGNELGQKLKECLVIKQEKDEHEKKALDKQKEMDEYAGMP